jgi:hypothetical protein
MMERMFKLVVSAALLLVAAAPAFGQGTATSSLSGVVTDGSGGAIPGATVVVKNNATSVTFDTVTNMTGQFSFPALAAGTYTVTFSLSGFKTFVANDVRLLAARPGEVNARLEVGSVSETISVKARTELVQSQTNAVSSTLSVEQLSELPLITRNALYAVALLPGVATTGGPRGAVINGLPNNTVNVTIDGISTGNMLQSTDGFFSMLTPRMDAVEEVTMTGAVPGSGGGSGSVQVGFVTRSGSNRYDGSIYHYYRSPTLNTNYYFNKVNNLDKNEVLVHQFGGRLGGPIVLPGFDGRGKAFFFHNFERQYQPQEQTRTRTMLRDSAMSGIFAWDVTVGGVTTKNTRDLMALAAANGQISTFDPTVRTLLAKIRTGAMSTGTINDLQAANTLQYVFQSPGKSNQYAPTTRIDVNVTPNQRITGTYWLQRFATDPDLLNNRDPIFPGQPNTATQTSWRNTGSMSLRSTLSSSIVNELRGGFQTSPSSFGFVTKDQFDDQDGWGLSFPANVGNGVTHTIAPAPRNTTTWSVENTLNWLRGAHSFTLGGSMAGVHNRGTTYNEATNIVLGFDTTNDPAAGLFNNANFPSASSANLTEARNLYALLTGRVASIPGTARLDANTGQYVYNGRFEQKSKQTLFAAYIQDSWRMKPTLTINAGLRWDLQMPFTAVTPTYAIATTEDICGISGVGAGPGGRPCNLFKPGTLTGAPVPGVDLYEPGTPAYRTNWTDFAPNAGIAWRPNAQGGFLRALLGDPEQATIRAGYALSYNQERIDRFEGSLSGNPGGDINVVRNNTTGYPLVRAGESHPVLFRERNRLGPPDFPASPIYPIAVTTADNVEMFKQDLRTPRVHSYSIGFQRSIGRDMAVEVRYVGNKNLYTWAEENWNERNILENGFLDEFRKAQGNLRANLAATGTASFAYTGAAGTQPLPTYLAYLSGRADATNTAAYTASQFTNPAFLARLSAIEPEVIAMAGDIDTTAFRANAARAGFVPNFFVMNPAVGNANVVEDRNSTRFNSMQIEVRRRLSGGLLVTGNYTYGIRKGVVNRSLHFDRLLVDTTDIPHAFKANWVYEVPVGRGRRFGTDMNRVMDGILGGWEFSGNARFQSQRYQIVGAKLEGMTQADLQKAFKIRIVKNATTGLTQVFSFPQDIIDNTRAAFNTDPTTATGYSLALGVPQGRYLRPPSDPNCIAIYRGDCNAPDIDLNGPLFARVDLRVKKAFALVGRATLEIDFELMNAFDTINFNHSVAFNPGTSTDTFRVTSAYTDPNTTNDPGGRIGQIVWRINW